MAIVILVDTALVRDSVNELDDIIDVVEDKHGFSDLEKKMIEDKKIRLVNVPGTRKEVRAQMRAVLPERIMHHDIVLGKQKRLWKHPLSDRYNYMQFDPKYKVKYQNGEFLEKITGNALNQNECEDPVIDIDDKGLPVFLKARVR